jgi:hypothetical protein
VTADPFGPLGPVSIFNVASQFEAHRSVTFRLQLSQMDWRVEAHEQAAPVMYVCCCILQTRLPLMDCIVSIKSVSPSGLAHGHGFRSGDIILAINSKSARWKTLSDVEAMLLASDGKTVTLRVQVGKCSCGCCQDCESYDLLQHAPIVRLEQLALSSDMSDLVGASPNCVWSAQLTHYPLCTDFFDCIFPKHVSPIIQRFSPSSFAHGECS